MAGCGERGRGEREREGRVECVMCIVMGTWCGLFLFIEGKTSTCVSGSEGVSECV